MVPVARTGPAIEKSRIAPPTCQRAAADRRYEPFTVDPSFGKGHKERAPMRGALARCVLSGGQPIDRLAPPPLGFWARSSLPGVLPAARRPRRELWGVLEAD